MVKSIDELREKYKWLNINVEFDSGTMAPIIRYKLNKEIITIKTTHENWHNTLEYIEKEAQQHINKLRTKKLKKILQ